METEYIQFGRKGPAPPLRPPSCWPPPSWPAKPELQNCKARRGANPHADFWGSENVEKSLPRLWAHCTRIEIWCVRWGRSAGARCETRRRRASACVRRVGCTTYTGSPPQTATLPEGVWHVMGRAEAHGVRCAGTDGGRVHYACGLWRMRGAPVRALSGLDAKAASYRVLSDLAMDVNLALVASGLQILPLGAQLRHDGNLLELRSQSGLELLRHHRPPLLAKVHV